MTIQNLISAILAAADVTKIIQAIASIRNKLPFLITLGTEQKGSIVKVGRGFAPFLAAAYKVSKEHPEILPPVFDVEEFQRDFELAQQLEAIAGPIDELSQAINDTLTAANSDAMQAALEIYAAVKQHADKVPGLAVIVAEMAEYFKRTRAKATTTNTKTTTTDTHTTKA